MEANSLLLEHTLVLAGEVVESGSVWQVKLSVPLSFLSITQYNVYRAGPQARRRCWLPTALL